MKQPTLEDRLEYVAALLFVRAVRWLPRSWLPGAVRFLGFVFFDLARYRRSVALANLSRHLSDVLPRRSYVSLGRESLTSFIGAITDLARLPLVTDRYIQENIEFQGLEHLDGALAAGRGAVLVTGHFGSWELMGCVIARLGYPINFVVGVQRNPLVLGLMNKIRTSCGIKVIGPGAILAARRALRSNQFVAMLSDQDAGGRHGTAGVFVDFLGEPAFTPRGAAQFALLASAPVVPGFIVRTGRGKHRIVIEEPIFPPEAHDEEAVVHLTTAYTRVIETYVRRYPGHWLWTHRRWKTRPA
ncbi:MAG TPA: lysophospholipid acyltransferase family protein [bacterium]|nr:lysophospholipid acyltransferase family protein [bacterium]